MVAVKKTKELSSNISEPDPHSSNWGTSSLVKEALHSNHLNESMTSPEDSEAYGDADGGYMHKMTSKHWD